MPQLLLELFSEEIPARMQKRAEEDLARAMKEKLAAHGLKAERVRTFSSPRRLGLVIEDLPTKAADVSEEKKGPRVGAPEQAVAGFLKSAGLARIEDAQVVSDKKGDFYVAKIERAGRGVPEILGDVVPEIVRAFPWPKSMRSGSSDLTWVRPLHNILCLFGGAPVKVTIEGVGNAAHTWGHRFHSAGAITPKDATDYEGKLRDAKVLIDREARKEIILTRAREFCVASKLELVEDVGLLEEVAGLVEWPVVLLGKMDPAFLDLPGEVIRLSMRTHQKYFAVRDPKSGKLAPNFVTVANIEASDGGKAIAAGNARVLSARLNDARFFWDTDRKTPLFTEERRAKLEKIVFHQKLGSVWDKVERVKALAVELCAVTGADKALVERAALLCKCDLVTETVGEFPELQGQIGRQLYQAELNEPSPLAGEGREGGRAEKSAASTSAPSSARPPPPTPAPRGGGGESVAIAIEDHYRPLGPNDRVPSDPVAVTLALADKLDTLVGFWTIDEKPTGSSDPYALRRAALGVVRILLIEGLRLSLARTTQPYFAKLAVVAARRAAELLGSITIDQADTFGAEGRSSLDQVRKSLRELSEDRVGDPGEMSRRARDLTAFLADRLKVQLRDQGKRHDLVDAVFALGDDDLVRIVARVEALDAFLKTEDGVNLLAGYKRAANIIAAEQKKGRVAEGELEGGVDAALLAEPAEKALHAALEKAIPAAVSATEKEDFAGAMKALAGLRAPVDAFFEGVLVNAEDAMLRRNRLRLLSRLREATSAVADFSKIES